MFNTTGVILQGGVGKNKSTVAVSIDKTLHYNYFKIPSAYAVAFVSRPSLAFQIFNISKTISRIYYVKLSVNIVVACRFIGSFRTTPIHVTQYDFY